MQIPKSSWVIKKVYFKVRLVEDFEQKYREYMYSIGESEDSLADSNFGYVVWNWLQQEYLWLYEFPEEITHWECRDGVDYFEEEDDDWVIPRHLFEPIE